MENPGHRGTVIPKISNSSLCFDKKLKFEVVSFIVICQAKWLSYIKVSTSLQRSCHSFMCVPS